MIGEEEEEEEEEGDFVLDGKRLATNVHVTSASTLLISCFQTGQLGTEIMDEITGPNPPLPDPSKHSDNPAKTESPIMKSSTCMKEEHAVAGSSGFVEVCARHGPFNLPRSPTRGPRPSGLFPLLTTTTISQPQVEIPTVEVRRLRLRK
ncbi:hypothetical protein FOPE_07110 [Fonsecaea pedrosoi]|nr:hypothetical protein FOPE_07110 [Fonsecaea pedrosoi]